MTKTINGTEISAKVGSYIQLDDVACGYCLLDCDVPPCPGWPGAEFLIPSVAGHTPLNIEITGRTIQYKYGTPCVRIRIEFVGDCEESTFGSAWLYV